MTAPALSEVHSAHIANLRQQPATIDGEGLLIGTQYVMFFAEADLMCQHVLRLLNNSTDADVLEVGLGLAVFAEQLVAHGFGSYTAIEPHEGVAAMAEQRLLGQLAGCSTIITEPWQLVTFLPESFDAIMYDTWPPDGHADADFAHFVEHVALPSLRPGGRFSFFISGDTLNDRRSAVLDSHFTSWTLTPYEMPLADTPPRWTKPNRDFLIPIAVKGPA